MPVRQSPDLSIIVPFYNETAFLETAISSVLSQSIENVEIIVVNDNPDKFDQSYFDGLDLPDVVRVEHHKKNRGLPSSRNTGIKCARGEFIGFLDADDYYLPGGLRGQLDTAQATGADVTHGQAAITFINKFTGNVLHSDAVFLGKDARGVFDGDDVVPAGFAIESSWSSLYRASFLADKNVAFDEEQVKFEDRIFVVEMLLAADRLAIMGKPVRVWRKRKNSITTSSKTRQERNLKINLLKKCVARWETAPREDARYWMMREFVRQACFMITKNETSPWYSAFGFSDDAESQEVTETLSELFASLEITQEDVLTSFIDQDPRYSKSNTKNGKITPEDLFAFIDGVAKKDYEVARDVITRCVERHKPEELPAPVVPHVDDPVEIILHLGLHKTGTTHVQQQLDANRAELASQGVLFPLTGLGFANDHSSVKNDGLPGHQRLITAIFKGEDQLLAQLKGEILGSDCKTVIISAENLSQPQSTSKVRARRIRKVFDALSEIGSVRPVAMYRRPDAWLQSFYGELVSNGNALGYQTPGEFLENNEEFLRFGDIVADIEKATGKHCEIMEFDRAAKEYDDLTLAFLDLCGINFLGHRLTFKPGTRYPSSCNAQISVARMLGLTVPDKASRQDLLRTFFRLTEPTSQRGPLFSKVERARMIEVFCENAASLFEARKIESPRDRWLKIVSEQDEPVDPEIPTSYIEAICQAGIFSGALVDSGVKKAVPTAPQKKPKNVAEISTADLNHLRGELEQNALELEYMKNSVSWRVSTPLRTIMRGWKRLRRA